VRKRENIARRKGNKKRGYKSTQVKKKRGCSAKEGFAVKRPGKSGKNKTESGGGNCFWGGEIKRRRTRKKPRKAN